MAEPGGGEARAAMIGQHICNGGLIDLGGSSREGERDLAQAQFEQAIAAAGLAVVSRFGVARARISIWRSLRPKRR